MVSCFRLTIGLSVLAVAAGATANPSYTVSVLSHGGFNNVTLKAVNSSGTVIGNAKDEHNNPIALLWRPGQAPVNLKDLGIDVHEAVDISDSGFILAKGPNPLGSSSIRWSQSTGSVELGMTSYNPIGVNNTGQVTGDLVPTLSSMRSYIWSETSGFHTLPHEGLPYTFSTGINNNGQVLFAGANGSGFNQASLWSPATGTVVIGNPLGGVGTEAIGLNDHGAVTGTYDYAGGRRAFYWTPDNGLVTLDTGNLGSTAVAINNLNQVIGIDYTGNLQGYYYLWSPDTGMQNLYNLLDPSAAGWTFERLHAISDSGHIVGTGRLGNSYYSVLLTPTNIVPEPSSLLALAGGAALLVRRRRKKRSQ